MHRFEQEDILRVATHFEFCGNTQYRLRTRNRRAPGLNLNFTFRRRTPALFILRAKKKNRCTSCVARLIRFFRGRANPRPPANLLGPSYFFAGAQHCSSQAVSPMSADCGSGFRAISNGCRLVLHVTNSSSCLNSYSLPRTSIDLCAHTLSFEDNNMRTMTIAPIPCPPQQYFLKEAASHKRK